MYEAPTNQTTHNWTPLSHLLRDLHNDAGVRHVGARIGGIVVQQLIAVPDARHLLDVEDILGANVAAVVVVLERRGAIVRGHRLVVVLVRRGGAALGRCHQRGDEQQCAEQSTPTERVIVGGSMGAQHG